MAGDWLKVECVTLDKPEILAMAEMLGTSHYDVFGRLFKVWSWFDQQTTNGYAISVTGVTLKKFIDAHVGSQGFATCMEKVGWLNDNGMPNFDFHNGESAKNRALSQRRMKEKRLRDSYASVTPKASPEKRREEVKQDAPPDGGPVWRDSLSILCGSGLSEKAARGFLGKCVRDYDEETVAAAITAAAGKADPSSYALGVLKTKPKRSEGKRVAI